jgi:hypothetical protein
LRTCDSAYFSMETAYRSKNLKFYNYGPLIR